MYMLGHVVSSRLVSIFHSITGQDTNGQIRTHDSRSHLIKSSQDKISVIQRDWPKDNHEDGYCDVIGKQQD